MKVFDGDSPAPFETNQSNRIRETQEFVAIQRLFFLTACFIKWGTETLGFALFGSWFVDTQHFQHLPSQRNFFFFFRAKRNFESLSCCDAVMESGDVSRMTLLLMKLFFRGHLFSRETMNLSKWSFVILTVMFSVWIPTSADSLTGKV